MPVLLPTSDQAAGSWTTTPLWSKVDDDSTARTTGDAVEITSDAVGNNTNTTNADLQLATGTDPGVDTNHVLRVRWRASAGSLQAHAELWEGVPGSGTMRAELISGVSVGTTEVEASLKLTTTQAGAITDYSNLYVRLWGRGTGGGAARSLIIELVDLYIPTVIGGFTIQTLRSSSAAGTNHVIDLPDGSNTTGRTLTVGAVFDVPATVGWPSGWTASDVNSTGVHLSIGRRIVDGTEGFDGTDDTITVTTTASMTCTHEAHLISGAHASTVPEVATATGLDAAPDPPSLDPTGWATETALWMAVCGTRFNETVTAAPTNYTNLFLSDHSTNGDNGALAFALRVLSAGSENPGTFTIGSSMVWVAATVAVRPGVTGTNAPAGNAAATGAAGQVEATIAPNAGGSTGAGTANAGTARVAPNAAPADATGSAPAATASIGAFAGSAVATGTALQPTVDTGGATTNAPAGLADGAGIAGQPAAAVAALPAAPTAAGTSDGTTVETGTFTNAPAGNAAATGTAPQPAAAVAFTAGPGAAIGTASQPLAGINPAAPSGLAAGTAGAATGHVAALAGLASAIGEAGAVFITEPPEPPEPAPILYNTLTGVTFNTVSHVSQEG